MHPLTSLIPLALLFITTNVHAQQATTPLRRRAQSPHRVAYHHAREPHTDYPLADLRQVERHLIKLESRYGSPDSAAARSDRYGKRWIDPLHIDLLEQLTGMFEDETDHDGHNFDGVSHFSTNKAAHVKSSKLKSTDKTASNGHTTATLNLHSQVSAGQDIEYFGKVKVGTPAQTFLLNFDTGSADLWLSSSACTSTNCKGDSRTQLDTAKSSTFLSTEKDFSLKYGIGGVSGKFGKDNFSIGDIAVKNQTFGVATKLSADYKTDASDGVMGLGFRSIASGHEVPPVSRIFGQNSVPASVISFVFGRTADGNAGRSQMRVGGVVSAASGAVDYTPVTKAAYWQIGMTSLSAAGASSAIKNVDAIVDTGTSSIAAPADVVADFYRGVKGARKTSEGYYTFPCANRLAATFTTKEGKSFDIQAQDMNLGKYEDGSSHCVGAVMSADTGGNVVLGLAALRNVVTVFDYAERRVGFASIQF